MEYILFGSGKKSEEVIKELGIENVKYFVDNNKGRWGNVFLGKTIFSPEKLLFENKSELNIIISSTFYKEISYQLKKMGFIEKIHFYSIEDKIMLEKFAEVELGENIQIIGVRSTEIGPGSCIGDNVWINDCIRDDESRVKIGDYVLIGRQSIISSAGRLEIGDYSVLAPRVYVSNADHNYINVNIPILEQGVTTGKKLIIEENCWLGVNSVISGNLTIHRGSVVGANSFVNKDVPPFSVVVGNPSKIVKMYNPKSDFWESIKNPTDIERILEIRSEIPLPDREGYNEILRSNTKMGKLGGILAGKNINI